jgi:hypothetical protein
VKGKLISKDKQGRFMLQLEKYHLDAQKLEENASELQHDP